MRLRPVIYFVIIILTVATFCDAKITTFKECTDDSDYGPSTEHYDQCLANNSIDQKLDQKTREEYFTQLIRSWKARDGARGFWIADNLLQVLNSDQKIFFSLMSHEVKEFDALLSNLDSHCFTYYGDGPSPMELKRIDLIKYLENGEPLDANAEKLRNKLIAELKTLVPSIIDVMVFLECTYDMRTDSEKNELIFELCLADHAMDQKLNTKIRGKYLKELMSKSYPIDELRLKRGSDYLLKICEAEQTFFFSFMASEMIEFNAWLYDLKKLSFTSETATPSDLEEKRARFIKVLKSGEPLSVNEHTLRKKLVEKLRKIRFN